MNLARPGHLVPVYLEFAFDLDTAVTAYAKLREPPFGFLLESVVGGERWARYSFLGSEPRQVWRLDEDRISIWTPNDGWSDPTPSENPFADFERWMSRFRPVTLPGLPRFWGGAVGYFGYDMVRWLERLPHAPPRDVPVPEACFLATDQVLILDNLRSRAFAVDSVKIPQRGADLEMLYDEAVSTLRATVARLQGSSGLEPLALGLESVAEARSNRTREDFEAAVRRVRRYILAGDAYQVVVSQRLETTLPPEPLDVYRALRTLNPSPYLFFLELDGVRLIGSSPESLVRVEAGEVAVRPIAGTRPRGASPEEDEALARELLADEKERAEHLMLVDLGRNDVGRVAAPGTVRVPELMQIERYSHVMHLVSEVTGKLELDRTALDALRACFPAGTLTGAPKIRAMEILDELEPDRRGPYGGAVGYVGYGGESLDVAIAIRTIVAVGRRAFAQAGAGIVHDSVPEREWEETMHKARVLLRALSVGECP
ncbi:MAG: anthranilate synthase component I [Gemmatimonadota bacterium]